MSEPEYQDGFEETAPGAVILGVPWNCPEHLALTAANFAAALDLHLICAFVDPASYLIEWAPPSDVLGMSLDPVLNEEAAYPAEDVLRRLQTILASNQVQWSFRVLNGGVAPALCRLAGSVGASMFVIGGSRPGLLARLGRTLEGSVAQALARSQNRPVIIVPQRRLSSHTHPLQHGTTQ